MTNINITGQYLVNGNPLSFGSNPSVIALSVSDGTVITGTAAISLSRALLIPANTFTTNGVLELMVKYQKTGTAGTIACTIYKNTSSSIVGATLVGTISSATNNIFIQGIRRLRLNSNQLLAAAPTSGTQFDCNTFTNESNITFDTSVDNYIIFAIQNASTSDSSVVEMARAVKYE